jgi:hypothetical protein
MTYEGLFQNMGKAFSITKNHTYLLADSNLVNISIKIKVKGYFRINRVSQFPIQSCNIIKRT